MIIFSTRETKPHKRTIFKTNYINWNNHRNRRIKKNIELNIKMWRTTINSKAMIRNQKRKEVKKIKINKETMSTLIIIRRINDMNFDITTSAKKICNGVTNDMKGYACFLTILVLTESRREENDFNLYRASRMTSLFMNSL